MIQRLILLASLIATPVFAQSQTQSDPGQDVSTERMQADMDTIIGFGTRHTLSSQTDPERGIGAAVNWVLAEFGRISEDCEGCLDVVTVSDTVTAPRIPEPTLVRNAVAIQRGSERPDEVIIIQGHYDSRVSDPLDWQSDSPGANDDGSGSVMILEAARLLSQNDYPSTIIYALLTGEEQGLFGARILADWVEEQGFTVKAVLNNDMIGNSCGSDGYCDAENVRVFSEGLRADSTQELRAQQRRFGGENDSPSRSLSRWLAWFAKYQPEGMQVRQIWRTDRMGRGGDQIPFLDKGYPAVRIMVAVEDYEHQHQDIRVEDGIRYGDTADELDWSYLTRAAQLNVRTLDQLAKLPMPPKVSIDGVVKTYTELTWEPVDGALKYWIKYRASDESDWRFDTIGMLNSDLQNGGTFTFKNRAAVFDQFDAKFEDGLFKLRISGMRADDWIFGVATCLEQLNCGPFSSAVPGGAFEPIAQAEGDTN